MALQLSTLRGCQASHGSACHNTRPTRSFFCNLLCLVRDKFFLCFFFFFFLILLEILYLLCQLRCSTSGLWGPSPQNVPSPSLRFLPMQYFLLVARPPNEVDQARQVFFFIIFEYFLSLIYGNYRVDVLSYFCSFIHSFSKFSLSTFYGSGMLKAEDRLASRRKKSLLMGIVEKKKAETNQ